MAAAAVGTVALWWSAQPNIPRATLEARWATPPSRFVTLPEGVRVHVRGARGGRGPSIGSVTRLDGLAVHVGSRGLNRLNDRFHIVAFDFAGHGLTGAVPGGDYSEEALVRFTLGVVDSLELRTFNLAGHSMGGRIAARFAEEHPERVTKLILIDAGGMGVQASSWMGSLLAFAQTSTAARAYRFVPQWVVSFGIDHVVVHKEALTAERGQGFWDFNHMDGAMEATLRRFRSSGSSMREHLAQDSRTDTDSVGCGRS